MPIYFDSSVKINTFAVNYIVQDKNAIVFTKLNKKYYFRFVTHKSSKKLSANIDLNLLKILEKYSVSFEILDFQSSVCFIDCNNKFDKASLLNLIVNSEDNFKNIKFLNACEILPDTKFINLDSEKEEFKVSSELHASTFNFEELQKFSIENFSSILLNGVKFSQKIS